MQRLDQVTTTSMVCKRAHKRPASTHTVMLNRLLLVRIAYGVTAYGVVAYGVTHRTSTPHLQGQTNSVPLWIAKDHLSGCFWNQLQKV